MMSISYLTLLSGLALVVWGGGPPGGYDEVHHPLYVDNGVGQMEIEILSIEEYEDLKHDMLKILGLKHVPKGKAHKIQLGNHTIPHFMKDIYESLTVDEGVGGELRSNVDSDRLMAGRFRITRDEVKVINECDVIRSFANRGHQEDLQWTQIFWFDTNELPPVQEEEVMRAELRLYKGPAAEDFDPEDRFLVRCFQLVEGSTGERNLLDSLEVSFAQQGWLIMNLTRALKAWQLDYHTNQGLMVEIVRKESPDIQLHPVAVGLATNRDSGPDTEAFMAAYFKSLKDSEAELTHNLRRKRSAERSHRKKSTSRPKKKKYSSVNEDFSLHPSSNSNAYRDFYGGRHRYRPCQRRMFRVSFRDLGWEEWIIAPDDYEAFYCHGECSFPLSSRMNATNHAIVQTLVHLMDPTEVPKPCCVAQKLSAISVLYFDESSNVILKKYQNMVAKDCGCH